MTKRILFTGEGSSDDGLVPHIEAVAALEGCAVTVTAPDFGRLGLVKCHSESDKLRALRSLDDDYDLIIVQRDADRSAPEQRREEIAEAVRSE